MRSGLADLRHHRLGFRSHRQLGCVFLEGVYQEALAIELTDQAVPFHREQDLPIRYKGRFFARIYRADFACFDEINVELKAISGLSTEEHAQLINYLKATGSLRGPLPNFGTARLETKRSRFD